MARIETRDEEQPQIPVGPPRGDEGLDDWFTRRLEAQGIDAGRHRIPLARIFSVIGLIVAVGALLWVLNQAANSSSGKDASKTTTTQTTGGNGGKSNTNDGGGKKNTTPPAVPWNKVKVTVINGNGVSGAAGAAGDTLKNAGWNIVDDTGNTNAGTTVTATEVVYPPGKESYAKTVAAKLGLPAPVAVADVPEVPSDTSTVTIVLGPDNLDNATVG